MRNTEAALLDRIRGVAEVCRENGIPCLANGDVQDYNDARRVMDEYQVDGAMIARSAELNPSCFQREGKIDALEVAREFLRKVCTFRSKLTGRRSTWTITSPTTSFVSLDS
jgi:tRNA-dihydrouridine synthase 2